MEAAPHHTKAPKREEIKKIKDILKKTKKFCLDKHQYETKKSPRGDDQKSLKKKSLFYPQIHVLKKERRPAWGKTCAACGERNLKPPGGVNTKVSTLLLMITPLAHLKAPLGQSAL